MTAREIVDEANKPGAAKFRPDRGLAGESVHTAGSAFLSTYLNDPTVHQMLKAGYSMEDIIVQLVTEKIELLDLLALQHSCRPIQIVLDKPST